MPTIRSCCINLARISLRWANHRPRRKLTAYFKQKSNPTDMNSRNKMWAFTIIELLAVLFVLGLVSASLLPALARTKASTQRISCSDNLKRIGVAFQTWGSSHSDLFPMSVPVSSGGYADFVGARSVSPSQATSYGVFRMFQVMSNEWSTPYILLCRLEIEARYGAST